MNTNLYTITSPNGLRLSSHPDGGTMAYLYYHESLAHDHIAHLEVADRWTIKPVNNLEEWRASLEADSISHVYEGLAESVSNVHDVRFWLTSLRAWRIGREIHGQR